MAAERGDAVLLAARSAGVEQVAADLRAAGHDAHPLRIDLTEHGAADAAVAAAAERLGGLDVLVNNAAIHRGGRGEKLPGGDFEGGGEGQIVGAHPPGCAGGGGRGDRVPAVYN